MAPDELLLDGQQRMTSLYQACMRRQVVETITPKKKMVKRWFYIDIQKAMKPDADRDDAIFSVPEDRRIKTNFDKDILLDLSKPEHEFEKLMFPLNQVFDWDEWQESFGDYWIAKGDVGKRDVFKRFKNEVLRISNHYQVPVIASTHDTSHEAVCLVFEKVNTGGKPSMPLNSLPPCMPRAGTSCGTTGLEPTAKSGMQTRLPNSAAPRTKRSACFQKWRAPTSFRRSRCVTPRRSGRQSRQRREGKRPSGSASHPPIIAGSAAGSLPRISGRRGGRL